jgi:hypothetical protein
MAPFRFPALLTLGCLACASDPTGPLATGTWGGTGIAFEVARDSTLVEFDCAHGVVRGPIRLESGRFAHDGIFVLEHGGPIREGEPPDVRAAVYKGKADGRDLELTVTVNGLAQEVGPYLLRRGAAPVLRKCL